MKIKYHTPLVFCGLFYMFCLFGALGVRTDEQSLKEQAVAKTNRECSDALRYVNGTIQQAPKIALTFDDGPNAQCTPKLLDGLKKRGVKATFFLIGENAEKNKEIVKRESEEGHLLGNHTYHHVEITRVSDDVAYDEITKTSSLIEDITGRPTEYMRPPFGLWQRDLEDKLKVFPVMWTIDPLDWTTENVGEIVNNVVTEAEEGDIILLHDCYKTSVEAALQIVDKLTEKGFEFVTVDELIYD